MVSVPRAQSYPQLAYKCFLSLHSPGQADCCLHFEEGTCQIIMKWKVVGSGLQERFDATSMREESMRYMSNATIQSRETDCRAVFLVSFLPSGVETPMDGEDLGKSCVAPVGIL